MLRITVSGHPGSGTSTLVRLLSEEKTWTSLNAGEVFRAAATEAGVSLEEFGQLCKEDLSMDENLDQKLKEHMRDPSGPEIIESRLAGWWADELQLNCLRVWLKVEGDERARRVAEREGGDSAHWKELAELRMERDQARYWQLYQIDLNDPKPYNCIITTDDLQAEEVFQQVLSALQEGL